MSQNAVGDHDDLRPQPLSSHNSCEQHCEFYAPLLTALFDGEASDNETRAARHHLARCLRCSHTWQQWNQTRYLLRSVPAPSPPVGLLTRVLLACRLSALTRLPRNPQSAPPLATSADAWDEIAHLPLGGFTWDDEMTPFAPSELQDAILRRTTRRPELHASHPTYHEGAERVVADFTRLTVSDSLRRWKRHVPQYAGTVAVPALLIGVVLWNQPMTQAPVELQTTPVATVRKAPTTQTVRTALRREVSKMQTRVAAVTSPASPISQMDAKPAKSVSAASVSAASASLSPSESVANQLRMAAAANLERIAQQSKALGTAKTSEITSVKLARAELVAKAPVVASNVRVASTTSSSRDLESQPRVKPRTSGNPSVAVASYAKPRMSVLRLVRTMGRDGSPSGARITSESSDVQSGSRIASVTRIGDGKAIRPRLQEIVSEAPRLAEAILPDSEAVHEALSELESLHDSRPDAIRDVMDAYMVSLFDDGTSSGEVKAPS
jgi:hypothetical protein